MGTVIRGAAGGVVATAVMSAFMWAASKVGLLHTPPPKEITARAENHSGLQPPDHKSFTASWWAAHFGYGAGCGVLFALVRRFLPGSDPAAGLLFGGIVWAVSYLGVMPALDLYPAPDDDSSSRTATMIAAHAVFGVSLAETIS